MYSITTDYFKDIGAPFPYLKRISDVGFSQVHWCHEWSTNHFYIKEELDAIKKKLKVFNLTILDIHASNGREISWGSSDENKRNAAVNLVKNRIDMAAYFNVAVIIMHVLENNEFLRKSLDELLPYAKVREVKIAIENTMNFPVVDKILSDYDFDFLGLCYDSGHGNIEKDSYEWLDKLKNRLISIHIHDNDGKRDLHQIPFTGTVDWERFSRLIAGSSYKKSISLEVSIRNMRIKDEKEFLDKSYFAAEKLSKMILR